MSNIEDLINQIVSLGSSERLFNPYSDCCPHEDKPDSPLIRRKNLHQYFLAHQKRRSAYLWVFEAPGYRGCRRTGLPLVSENLLDKVSQLLETSNPLRKATKTETKSEYSANVVWKTINQLKDIPLIWNAFPLHPFKKDRPFSNRTPSKNEIKAANQIIQEVIKIFQPKKILAVGRVANKLLEKQGFTSIYIRHPANGGVGQFQKGIKKFHQL